MLADLRYEPKGGLAPNKAVVLLHGLGSNNRDLIGLAPEIAKFMPDTLFVSVNAPYKYEFSSLGGYQWFSVKDWDEKRISKEIEESSNFLKEYLSNLAIEFDFSYNQIFLVGFSQGAMMSLHTGLRLDKELGGIIALSGKLIIPNLLSKQMKARPSVMLNHGKYDEVVPYSCMEEAKEVMELAGIKVATYTSLCGHTIDSACLNKIIGFLNK